jgi:fucose permease
MKPVSPKLILAINYLIFLCFGMFLGGLGPVFNELAQKTSSTLTVVGGVLTFLFLGSLLAQIIAGPLTDRYGHRNVLVVSLFILGLGIIGFTNAFTIALMFGLAFVTGIGQGGVDIGANLVVSDSAPGDNTAVLNLLHFFFGVGAFIGPALIGFAIASTGSGLIVHWFSAGVLLLLALAIFFLVKDQRVEKAGSTELVGLKNSGFRIYLSPLLWLLGVLMLVYVGVEFGLGSWISNYMQITLGTALEYGALVTSVYWGALAMGRLAGAAASRRLTRMKLLLIAITSSLAGAIGLIFSRWELWPTILCIAWMSFSYGTVYPTTVALGISAFSDQQGKAVGFLVAAGNIGGIILPWLAGILLVNYANMAYSVFLALLIGLALGILVLIGRMLRGKTRAEAASLAK